MPSSFLSPLRLEYLDGCTWMVWEPFDFASEVAQQIIHVPKGFITDFASVPRVFWRIIPPTGQYGKAAVVHDYLYTCNLVDKATADKVFREAMEVLGVGKIKRNLMYQAVKMFGRMH